MTDTARNNASHDNGDKSLGDRARDAASSAQEKATSAASTAKDKVSSAASATIDAAKEHPYAAAGIAVGVVAAVGGAALAASKLGSSEPKKPAPRKAPAKKS